MCSTPLVDCLTDASSAIVTESADGIAATERECATDTFVVDGVLSYRLMELHVDNSSSLVGLLVNHILDTMLRVTLHVIALIVTGWWCEHWLVVLRNVTTGRHYVVEFGYLGVGWYPIEQAVKLKSKTARIIAGSPHCRSGGVSTSCSLLPSPTVVGTSIARHLDKWAHAEYHWAGWWTSRNCIDFVREYLQFSGCSKKTERLMLDLPLPFGGVCLPLLEDLSWRWLQQTWLRGGGRRLSCSDIPDRIRFFSPPFPM